MKKIVPSLLVFLFAVSAFPGSGQSPVSGTVSYESESISKISVAGQELNQKMNLRLTLEFSGDYCRVNASLEVDPEEGGSGFKLNGIPSVQKYYVPRDKAFYQVTLAKGKNYAIRSESKKITDLKMTGRKDTILGYACLEFTCNSSGELLTGWYTPDLPAIVAPDDSIGLPGGILKVESKSYRSIVTAIKTGNTTREADLKLPSNAIKISRGDFMKEITGN